MSIKNILIALFTTLFLWIVYIVISTSIVSNLFTEWDSLKSIPWMQATLWDFYANIAVLLVWIYYRESNIAAKGLWTILFITLGSIGVTGYVLLQLFRLKPGDGLEKILVKSNLRD